MKSKIRNLKTDYARRAVMFEHLARMNIRKRRKNNFIFNTRNFDDLSQLAVKYRLDIAPLDIEIIDFLQRNFHSVDLIEMDLSDLNQRIVKNVVLYEVKTKNHSNNSKLNLAFSSYNAYDFMKRKGVTVNLASFELYDNWKYKFSLEELNLDNFKKYTRFKQNPFGK